MREAKVSSDDFKKAFEALLPHMHRTKRQLLRIMMIMPNQTASSRWLKRQLEVRDHIVVNGAIGKLGAEMLDILGRHPDGAKGLGYQTWTVIATMGKPIDAGFPWKLRPEVVEALSALGFGNEKMQGEEAVPVVYCEGSVVQRLVNAYERDNKARIACIEEKGVICEICHFEFSKTYGKDVAGFIHIHHLKPLFEIRQNYEVDPIRDLVPICPNCHAVIHYGNKTRTLQEVRDMLIAAVQS